MVFQSRYTVLPRITTRFTRHNCQGRVSITQSFAFTNKVFAGNSFEKFARERCYRAQETRRNENFLYLTFPLVHNQL